MDRVAGKLRDEGPLPLLLGGPGQRNPEQRLSERLMVSEQGKIPTFQEEFELSHDRVSSQEIPVQGGVMGLGEGQLLREKGKWSPESSNQLLKNSSNV